MKTFPTINTDMIDVTCAIIIRNNMILITQRDVGMSRAGKWEFPGGKVKEGESIDDCIVREIKEELNIEIRVKKWLEPVEYSYPDIEIRLIPSIATVIKGEIKLSEHSRYEWVKAENLLSYNWSSADVAVVKQLM